MSRRRRPLTLAEHERLGELLSQAEQCLFEAYKVAATGYTMAELKPLERLWRLNGPLERLRSWFDSQLYREAAQRDAAHDPRLPQVYYGAQKRLEARKSA